jgi:hypothetical protein
MISPRLLALVKNYSETESPRYSPDLTPSDHNTLLKIQDRRTYLFLLSSFALNTGCFEMPAQILITSYWLHVELGTNIMKQFSINKL